ncbi:GTP 3',8-cyclase MoaA [Aestuariirhabdus litorea]|uniref:GTP 3',8-cyclase n=1 Tax=Aestuariirhabdus litorea TaxID=2528527 RepID=A0A3P3VP19_9GAMM|nr:GTP 3',8-cyclase MoaA [Aestuariirhabdus litorea]RRJ83396.1 GTP 3',8-cyclase MoaA [Aestuariirhabdus litorea]RWW93557.1 GTP 3',8-cyclase MoaA [Endozoicomonadaceae bacterium GTF-13]
MKGNRLIDRFGREVTYVRMSVTDRCDFRCVYCMGEEMTFLPREQVLTLEEMALIGRAFSELGVNKIRLTGGEPLVRNNVMHLVRDLGALPGITNLAMTTNGSQLPKLAPELKAAGLKSVNISLDTLDPVQFTQLTRTGKLERVLEGIEAARAAGFPRIKLNAVIMKGRNDDQVVPLVRFARDQGVDISFIEEMPLGHIDEHHRGETLCTSEQVRELIGEQFELVASTENSGGPSRYYHFADHPTRVGFISPHSHNFCGDCNRVRVTSEGRLLLCLGNEHSTDLRAVVRRYPGDIERLKEELHSAMELKPERHFFSAEGEVEIVRFMNMTGG